MIPIPPSHCVNWRQRAKAVRQLLDPRDALPPVVLKPDIPSKNASTGRSSLRVAGEDVQERAERRRCEPRQRDDEEPFADSEPVVAARQVGATETLPTRRAGGEERPDLFAVADRDSGRHEDEG